ncbi:hypothetical protein C7212DRAFT_327444 [Tuber magnatum]|uniref:Uncharacterized protein n=1 Tax=Tuber magnatum TaxID=42249 RepID=A0A317SMF9_9PEZI|nr:hypothetical protein C7212DRAFT_327444 [Tuber magnatum]
MGNSCSGIVDYLKYLGGLLTSGTSITNSTNITYITPISFIINSLKANRYNITLNTTITT